MKKYNRQRETGPVILHLQIKIRKQNSELKRKKTKLTLLTPTATPSTPGVCAHPPRPDNEIRARAAFITSRRRAAACPSGPFGGWTLPPSSTHTYIHASTQSCGRNLHSSFAPGALKASLLACSAWMSAAACACTCVRPQTLRLGDDRQRRPVFKSRLLPNYRAVRSLPLSSVYTRDREF